MRLAVCTLSQRYPAASSQSDPILHSLMPSWHRLSMQGPDTNSWGEKMSIRLNTLFKAAAISVVAGFAVAGCEKGSPTDPVASETVGAPTNIEPVAALGTASYPGVKVAGKVTVCKDASSPAGTYNFTASSSAPQAGDQISANFNLTPGTCAIVWERTADGNATGITVTEVVPGGASYRLDHITSTD